MKNKKSAGYTEHDRARHLAFYRTLSRPVSAVISRLLKYSCDADNLPQGPFLMLYNHNTDYDFILTACTSRKHMYFVASEHIYQLGIASRLLRHYAAPIARLKGGTASSTVMEILRTLKSGYNVCLAPEGNRSFSGKTCPIAPATGKMVRSCGASLVTFRIEGGYFTTPRWSYSLRRGRMRGSVVGVYTPEQLRSMTTEEVNEIINRDLYEDAYARQQQILVPYKGKRLAEGLEHALYTCPKCGKTGDLHSEGNRITCSCGLSAVYDQYGTLHDSPYSTVTEWDAWQRTDLEQRLERMLADGQTDTVLFSDENTVLSEVSDNHRRKVVAQGTLVMTADRLTVGEHNLSFDEISGIGMVGRCRMVFSANGKHYEINVKKPKNRRHRLNARKYIHTFEHLCKLRGKAVWTAGV